MNSSVNKSIGEQYLEISKTEDEFIENMKIVWFNKTGKQLSDGAIKVFRYYYQQNKSS